MDFMNKTSTEIRLIMKEHGWSSEDRLSTLGWGDKFGYSIWFRKSEWHGRNTFALIGQTVCFYRHTDDLSQIDNIIRECAEQCLKAYEEYTDCLPYQISYKKIGKHNMTYDWNNPSVISKL